MDTIGEILSIVRKGPDLVKAADPIKMNTKSVVRGAKDATFQFPVLISDTVAVDMANTFARTMDRVYASFTQTWISMHPFMDISVDPTPLSYLKRLHQNMRLESVIDYEDDGEILEKDIKEAYAGETLVYTNPSCTRFLVFKGCNPAGKKVLESHMDQMTPYLQGFNLSPITEAITDNTSAYDLANALMDNRMKEVQNKQIKDRMDITAKNMAPKMTERDLKKANDMVPYGIQVRLIAKNGDNEFVQYIDFVLGVKAVLHIVKSEELIENIQRSLRNKSLMFKLLRWTSGEISLMKNVILNMDELKRDAIDRQNGRSPWFSTLRRLRDRRVGVRNFTVPHALIPNATIAISREEMTYMEETQSIQLKDPRVVKKMMDAMFLVTFAVLDDGTGTLDLFYDGADSYETYALETLERENSANSNKLGREIGRMISR